MRDDYQVLEGINRHVILATGWVQEEENLKRRLGDKSEKTPMPYLTKELGNNRYQRLADFDWRAGDKYWQKTGPFWRLVRKEWANVFERHNSFTLNKTHENTPLFMALFELAERFDKDELEAAGNAVKTVIDNYVVAQ